MTYELPRTESGENDWMRIHSDILRNSGLCFSVNPQDILKAVDANARAEEREAIVRAGWSLSDDMSDACPGEIVSAAIRARGEES